MELSSNYSHIPVPAITAYNSLLPYETRACRNLWIAVLKQAVHEIFNYRLEDYLESAESRIWGSSKSKDFILVCENAGYDPTYVHEKLQKRMDEHKDKFDFQRSTYKEILTVISDLNRLRNETKKLRNRETVRLKKAKEDRIKRKLARIEAKKLGKKFKCKKPLRKRGYGAIIKNNALIIQEKEALAKEIKNKYREDMKALKNEDS